MFKLVTLVIITATVHAVEFEITNYDGGDIWVGIQGNDGIAPLEDGGFILGSNQSRTVNSPEDWAGRFWARTWCDPNTNHCLTGDCGDKLQCEGSGGVPPASLAEITLKGPNGLDTYDLSLVDGFNILISFEPVDGKGDDSQYSCKKASCDYHFNSDCPEELQVKSEHGIIACMSACLAMPSEEYCCTGEHDKPWTCKSSDWPVNYPEHFKSHCPDAYSYAYDDHKSTFTCLAEKYIITFGG